MMKYKTTSIKAVIKAHKELMEEIDRYTENRIFEILRNNRIGKEKALNITCELNYLIENGYIGKKTDEQKEKTKLWKQKKQEKY